MVHLYEYLIIKHDCIAIIMALKTYTAIPGIPAIMVNRGGG
ncbi:hypothetical protein DSUL_20042 [Desulfovibrionales bacterium]